MCFFFTALTLMLSVFSVFLNRVVRSRRGGRREREGTEDGDRLSALFFFLCVAVTGKGTESKRDSVQ